MRQPTLATEPIPEPKFSVRSYVSALATSQKLFSVGLVLTLNLFLTWFVLTEHRVFFWDDITYWLKFEDVALRLESHPLSALHSLVSSVRHDDYNELAIWPLTPFALIFGTSRLCYSLAVLNVYLIPTCASFLLLNLGGATARQRSARLLPAALLVAFSPFLWDPLLSGFLDVGGLILANAVIGLCWRFPLSERRSPRFIIALAVLLALMPLFRRWYSFWAISFFLTSGICELWRARKSWLASKTLLLNLGLLGVCYLIVFLAAAGPLARRVLNTNYSSAYSAYRLHSGIFADLVSLFARLGPFQVGLAVGGFVLAVRSGSAARGRILFLLLQWVLIFVMFTRIQDFNVHQSYLLMQLIIAAQVFLVTSVSFSRVAWALALGGLVSFGHVLVPAVRLHTATLGSILPAALHFPERRSDLKQLVELRNTLLKLDPTHGPIYVLASSAVLNSHTVKYVERSLGLERQLEPAILWTQSIDKSVGVPSYFFAASLVVVADPVQYHLRPEDQRVIGTFAEALLEQRGIGLSYSRLPYEFKLENNTRVYVYQKLQHVPAAQVDELRASFARDYPAWSRVTFDPPG